MIDVKYFEIPLPEDILKEKWSGHFKECIQLIDKRLEKDIPESLKKRLLLEKEVIERLPSQYPYTKDEVLEKFKKYIPTFTMKDIDELIELNQLEWIYIYGVKHFHELCFENILKTRRDITGMIQDVDKRNHELQPKTELNEMMKKMKENHGIKYHIHLKETIKIKKEKEGKKIKVHLPLPIEYHQVENVKILNVSHSQYILSPRDHNARTLYIEEEYKKGVEFSVEFSYDMNSPYIEYKAEDVSEVQPTYYTEELVPHIVFTPYLKQLAIEIVGNETNPLLKAKKIYDYITTHVTYSFVRGYFLIENIGEYSAKNLKGDCGLQALLFITLCRIVKVPARWQAGLYVSQESVGNHDWAEIYVAPFGWLPVDCSFGGSAYREGNEERREFYFSHLDPLRMPACNDFQVPLYPAKKYQRQDPYDNQDGEVEYEDEGLLYDDYETIRELIELKEI
ncbi:MAG: transglutaminase-like domain-containing protein [Bacilli bacterium]|nr:transglutaminase-like domain-containing protein [Bacilli bacterium]